MYFRYLRVGKVDETDSIRRIETISIGSMNHIYQLMQFLFVEFLE